MRYIDDLLALYPGKDPFTRKFLLAQIVDQPADPYSGELVDFLWAETRSEESVVRRQARHTLGQFLPVHTAFSFRFQGTGQDGGAAQQVGGVPGQATADARLLARGAAAALDHHLPRLTELMTRGSSVERVTTSLVLGRLHNPALVRALARAVLAPEFSYQAAYSLSESGEEDAVQALVRAIARHGRARPDLFMLLRALPSEASLACLKFAEPRTDSTGRANIALALAQYPSRDCRPLLDLLIRRCEGWVTAYVLDTLAGFGDPDDLPLIRLAYQIEEHEFIRAQALRAAGTIDDPAARSFLAGALPECRGRNQAVALEALSRQSMPDAELAAIARPYLGSDHVGTAVKAIVLVGLADPDEVVEPLSRVLLAPNPSVRREGVFALGELRFDEGVGMLERVITGDPSTTVRVQAIKSLGRYPTDTALSILTRILECPSPRLLVNACRTIGGLQDNPAVVVDELTRLARALTLPAARSPVLRTLGRVARALDRPVPEVLLEGLESRDLPVVVGALEGLKYVGDRIPVERIQPLTSHVDPRVRARATLALFLSGRAPHAEGLAEMLASGEEATTMEALGVLMEIGLVAPCVGQGGFDALAADLRARAQGPVDPRSVTPLMPAVGPAESESSIDEVELAKLVAEPAVDLEDQEEMLRRSMAVSPKHRKGDSPSIRTLSGSRVGGSSARNLAEMIARAKQSDAPLEGGASQEEMYLPPIAPRIPAVASSSVEIPLREAPGPTPGPAASKPAPRSRDGEAGPSPLRLAPVVGVGLTALIALALYLAQGGPAPGPRDPGSPSASASTSASASVAGSATPRVWSTVGHCGRIEPDGLLTPIAVRALVPPGRVGTRAGGQLELGFKDGSSILFAAVSEVDIGGVPPVRTTGASPPVVLGEPSGTLTVHAKASEFQLRLGGAGYRMTQGKLKVTGTPAAWTLEQLEGDGMLVRSEGQLDTLVTGQSRTVERAGAAPR